MAFGPDEVRCLNVSSNRLLGYSSFWLLFEGGWGSPFYSFFFEEPLICGIRPSAYPPLAPEFVGALVPRWIGLDRVRLLFLESAAKIFQELLVLVDNILDYFC